MTAMFIIEATKEEIDVLRQMLHRACLHSGMDVAEAAAHWNRKLVAASMPMPPEKANGQSDGKALM